MDSTVSVSKGCFAFKRKRKGQSLCQNQLTNKPWYKAYKNCLESSQDLLSVLEKSIFSDILGGLIDYVNSVSSDSDASHSEIPAATLLTGVNMPDHTSLFATLARKIAQDSTPYVATLWSHDCSSLKAAVERMCSQFIVFSSQEEMDCDTSIDNDLDRNAEGGSKTKAQRLHCNLQYFSYWYSHTQVSPQKKRKINKPTATAKNCQSAKPLVVIIPDFESFSSKVLQDFILLIKGYQKRMPFVLVLGVATAVSAVHRSLPHHVSSCLRMKIFHSQPSLTYLNEVLEKVVFLPNRPFHLGGKTFKLLMDVFLFHDFSVMGFIQGYKYCMTQHFYGKDWTVLSCASEDLPLAVKQLSKSEIESLRMLPSIRKHIESLASRADMISWIKDDSFVKEETVKLLTDLHKYVDVFFVALKCLNILTASLPGAPLEKHLRSVYTRATTCDIIKSAQLKECMTLLSFLSSEELESKLREVLPVLQEASKKASQMSVVSEKVSDYLSKFKTLWAPALSSPTKALRTPCKSPSKSAKSPIKSPLQSPTKILMNVSSRSQLKEKLKEISTQDVKLSPFEKLRSEILTFLLEEVFTPFLASPQTKPFHELVFFDDIADVKKHIVGAPRQAILRGLKDPHFYLDCDCCTLSDLGDILPTLPDVSIVYKLHLESGKLINMFDWLQSFLTIVNPSSTEEQTEVDPKLQARFTRAVAELQFLGFIKSSNRKTDHVTRLTWC